MSAQDLIPVMLVALALIATPGCYRPQTLAKHGEEERREGITLPPLPPFTAEEEEALQRPPKAVRVDMEQWRREIQELRRAAKQQQEGR